MPAPTSLRVEHLDEPFGLTVQHPRLSWRLPGSAHHQLAFRVRANDWDSGEVRSNQSVLVPYAGPELRSGERVDWTVKVWTDLGESDWAEPSSWEMGLLHAEDWTARWIEPAPVPGGPGESPRPAQLFRHAFIFDQPVRRARLYATAHGIYECFLNGERVGDLELTPGFTSYWSNLQVQTHDVLDLLKPGGNVLSAVVSDGWFRGQVGGCRLTETYGKEIALLAQLELVLDDGSTMRVGTGPNWTTTQGAILAADLIEGQTADLGRDPGEWLPVAVRDYDLGRLTASPAPPVRRVEELRPIAVTTPGPGRQVFDLGQNINGWVRLGKLGPTGTKLRLTHGETVDQHGDVSTENILVDLDGIPALADDEFVHLAAPLQVDQVTSAGRDGEAFEPRHTTHGFQFVEVRGHPETLTADDLTGVVVHTDLRRIGWFECSDARINALHEAAVWGFRGNACDVPTDCPTRERAGWTGDWQVFAEPAAFLYDVAGFSAKWLKDLAAEQQADGLVLNCAPNVISPEIHARLGSGHGSAGWGDAAVLVPWEMYRAYGDRDLLAAQWTSMAAWVEYAARQAADHRHPDRVVRSPEPAAHERYLWDTGFHWGEWLEPGDWDLADLDDNIRALAEADQGDVATAFLHRSSSLLAKIALVLARPADARHYQGLADATRQAWQAEYVRDDGTLLPDRQAGYVRALAYDLAPEALRPQLARRLVELIEAAGGHLATGFLATPHLLPVLAEAGHLGTAYQLLFQDTEPSWLTMVDRGATTIWEAWNGIDERGTAHLSLNHYSKGAVVSFLHRYVGGIQLLDDAPGFRRFRVAPRPGAQLDWARTAHDSPYGPIDVHWTLAGSRFELVVTVPAGTSAEVVLPDGARHEAAPGVSRYGCVLARR